jgi:hypothetical protein
MKGYDRRERQQEDASAPATSKTRVVSLFREAAKLAKKQEPPDPDRDNPDSFLLDD